ncbi:MAG: hypothetical protein WCC28_20265 [Mycobacterium sp.]|uniref:hypothetical protein n=1 Tax=Mycobacterium sp. TaxID=1785 RepID=UPI003C722659
MAAVAGAPGLSALLTWPTDHLTEAAAHWETVGERSYSVAHGVWSDTLTVDWSGEAAEALRTDTHADMMTTSAVVDQLQSAASVARSGASELDAARSQMRYAVEDAGSAGFEVGEDLSVTDRMSGESAAQQVARRAAAQAFAADIGGRAAQLVSLDTQVAGRITAAVAGVGSTFPGQVRAVDNRTFKQSPDQPPPPSPKGPSAADMRKVVEKLPEGTKPWIKEVRTPEDLQNLKNWMTQDSVDGYNRYEDPAKGAWKRLPDGSEVGERYSADSTGKNALEIDLKGSDGTTQHWKIHMNPKTGGVPDIPAVEPAPVEAAPAEPAPTKSGPVEDFEGGGPAVIPAAPHFVHPPGSIDHGIPVIGEDDPGESPRDFRR